MKRKMVSIISVFLLLSEHVFAVQQDAMPSMQWQVLQKGIEYRVIKRHYENEYTTRQVMLHAFRIQQGLFDVVTHSFHDLDEDQRTSVREFRQQNKALLVLSGGFFQASFREPVGLVIVQGKRLFPLAKSLSGVLWIKNGKLHFSTTKDFQKKRLKPDYALQGYPRIVDPINKRGIQTKRTLFKHRAAVCGVKEHFIFLVSDKQFSGLSLYELASIAQEKERYDGLACEIAINLDGGPAPALSVDEALLKLEIKERIGWQVPNVLMVLPKKTPVL